MISNAPHSEEQSSINVSIAKLRDDCVQLKIGFRTQIKNTQDSILGAIDALNKATGETQTPNDTPLSDLSRMLRAIQAEMDDIQLQHRILRHLVFEDMDSRANQIPNAARDTYNWTVEDGPVNEKDQRRYSWQVFLEWLRTGDKILHVSGNPGSGKSTLMKFLSQHERTRQELQAWAGVDTLIFCVFYFWNPGSQMQRTLSGLYRSLLFQALTQCPELAEVVFPVQVRTMRASFGDMMVEKTQNFGEYHIEEAFKLLLKRASSGGYRLCFFIDGLDECEGNRLQHEGLTNMLQNWVSPDAIKICLSSRPYSEFLQPLDIPGNCLIQLHELNESDIRAYCLNRLENDIYARERGNLCQRLAGIVVAHAQGVFLWVHLVVDILLEGFRQDDPDSVLEAQLEALPSDIDKLYTKLRKHFESNSIQRVRSDRMLLLAARNQCRADLIALAFSWLEEDGNDLGGLMNPDFPPVFETKPYSIEEVHKRINHVARQINGLARGFLEVWENKHEAWWPAKEGTINMLRIRFCHRTARDYLLQSESRRRELLQSFPNFEDSQPYARICLAEHIHRWNAKIGNRNIFEGLDQQFLQKMDPGFLSKFKLRIQELAAPMIVHVPSSALHLNPPEHYTRSPVSFMAYAAHCGLDRFVLHEAARNAKSASDTPTTGNYLLAAVRWRNFDLASALLSLGRGMSELCVIYDLDGNVQALAPACIPVMAYLFETLMDGRSSEYDLIHLELLKKTLSCNFDLQNSIWVTIRGTYLPSGTSKADEATEPRARISLVDAIELIKVPSSQTQDYSCEASTVRTTGMVKEVSSNKGVWVEGPGPGVVQWLKEWVDQSNHDVDCTDSQTGRRLSTDIIEWTSGTKECVKLRGYTRLC